VVLGAENRPLAEGSQFFPALVPHLKAVKVDEIFLLLLHRGLDLVVASKISCLSLVSHQLESVLVDLFWGWGFSF